MDEEADQDLRFVGALHASPALVSLAAFSSIQAPSCRRVSSNFIQPSRHVPVARRLAWLSLEGRVINAEEASSARAVGLKREEAVAWEMFSPVQRFLIVAVIGAAVAESKKNRQIWKLEKAVELRDQVLLRMQQKLDDLCEQANQVKDQPGDPTFCSKNEELASSHEAFGSDKIMFVDCGCWLCDQHQNMLSSRSTATKSSSGDEMFQYKVPLSNEAEQEERRMSDLSDWASSVTSAAEIQMNSLAIDQDMYNLKRESEEKDATIKELTTLLEASNVSGSKRATELQEIIRRKNMIISKLKKDMVVLEQKVMQLTRLRRPSFSASESSSLQPPPLRDNLLYDMSSTSPSSSDSDSSPLERPRVSTTKNLETLAQHTNSSLISNRKSSHSDFSPLEKPHFLTHLTVEIPTKCNDSSLVRTNKSLSPKTMSSLGFSKSRSGTPLKEISTNHKSETATSPRQREFPVSSSDSRKSSSKPERASSSLQREFHASSDFKKSRRRSQAGARDATPQRRWA